MRHLRMFGLTLLALFAFGVVVASTAAAEEKEPAGLLFLAGETAPVTMEGKSGEMTVTSLPGGSSIRCTAGTFKATAGAKGETHVTLGTATITVTGCKAEVAGSKLSCSSENAKAEKDAKETVLVEANLHFVSLETSAKKLVPGILWILLAPIKLNCAGVKITTEGTAIAQVEKASATADVTEVGLNFVSIPSLLKCDEKDALCTKLLKEFACAKSGSLCINITGELESLDLVAKASMTIKPMVLIDF